MGFIALKKTFIKIISAFFSILFIFSYSGCENFLNGDDLKNEIDKQILISNSSRPEIVSVEPRMIEGGSHCDSNIIVTFSKTMNINGLKTLIIFLLRIQMAIAFLIITIVQFYHKMD